MASLEEAMAVGVFPVPEGNSKSVTLTPPNHQVGKGGFPVPEGNSKSVTNKEEAIQIAEQHRFQSLKGILNL